MLGVSFGEILVIIIIACIFIKPSEMQQIIYKYSKLFFKVKHQITDSIEKINQDMAISQYNSSLSNLHNQHLQTGLISQPNFSLSNFLSSPEYFDGAYDELGCSPSKKEENYDLFSNNLDSNEVVKELNENEFIQKKLPLDFKFDIARLKDKLSN